MSFLDSLDPKYRLILCDLWGVVHNGVELYPGAAERLRAWRSEGRCVILLTNAPRTEEAVEQQLQRIGLPRDCWDAIATSGEAGIAALNALDAPVGFIGTAGDRAVLEGRGVRIAANEDFAELACTGIREGEPDPEQYRAELERLADRIVSRAQRAGAVRRDVKAADVRALVRAALTNAPPGQWRRYLDVVLDGLRA